MMYYPDKHFAEENVKKQYMHLFKFILQISLFIIKYGST